MDTINGVSSFCAHQSMAKPDLSDWKNWGLPEAPTFIKLFSLGKNHQTALIESAEKKYVIKQLKHSFEQALRGQNVGQSLGLAPKVYFANNTLLLTEYVENTLPSIEHTAQALRLLHAYSDSKKPHNESDQTTTNSILSTCDQYAKSVPTELQTLHHRLQSLLKEFDQDTTQHCFCHNDLVNENCLTLEGQAMFIDWEFSGVNNPWFDLASIIVYRELNEAQTTNFLAHYAGWQDKAQQRIFTTSQIAVIWCDILWHINKFGSNYVPPKHISTEKIETLITTI